MTLSASLLSFCARRTIAAAERSDKPSHLFSLHFVGMRARDRYAIEGPDSWECQRAVSAYSHRSARCVIATSRLSDKRHNSSINQFRLGSQRKHWDRLNASFCLPSSVLVCRRALSLCGANSNEHSGSALGLREEIAKRASKRGTK